MSPLKQQVSEYRQALERDAKSYARYFSTSVACFSGCLVASFLAGPGQGWVWLLGALLFMGAGLVFLIEARHAALLSSIQAVSSAVRNQAEQ
jgi:fatty acid desaturase